MSTPAKPRVLCLDDELDVLESLRDTLRRKFQIVVTTNGFEALRMLAAEPYEVVLSDMRMPLLNGARFLSLAREHAPDTVRVMLTGHSALPDAAAAINEGQIFRLLIKPCKTDDLTTALQAAVEQYHVNVREREADARTGRSVTDALVKLAACADPNGPDRATRVRRHAVELAEKAENVKPSADLELACELMQIGAVALSHEVLARAAQVSRIGQEQAGELEKLPELAAPLLPDLPQFKTVTAMLLAAGQQNATSRRRWPEVCESGNVLRIALDYELQLRQGSPGEFAVRTLQGRSGRYDEEILATFASMMQFT
jgi:response regulator RpfG family c-di-GMP phosphodiesterase